MIMPLAWIVGSKQGCFFMGCGGFDGYGKQKRPTDVRRFLRQIVL